MAIRRTFVQYFTTFQLTACLRGPSKRATAGLRVPDVVVFGFQDGRAVGKWEVVQGECHDLDSGAEIFGDDLPFYRYSSISYTTILWNANIHITLLCNNVEVDWKAMRAWKTNRGCMPRPNTGHGSHYACCTVADCISTPTGALSTPTSKFLATGLLSVTCP